MTKNIEEGEKGEGNPNMLTLPCLAPRETPGRRSWLLSACRGCARPPSREAASSCGGWRPPVATAAPAPPPASLTTRASYSNCHVSNIFIVSRYFSLQQTPAACRPPARLCPTAEFNISSPPPPRQQLGPVRCAAPPWSLIGCHNTVVLEKVPSEGS